MSPAWLHHSIESWVSSHMTSNVNHSIQNVVLQVVFSVVIFVLLGSENGFSTKWQHDAFGEPRAPALYNALFTTIAFLLGAITSIISGYLGACLGIPFFTLDLLCQTDDSENLSLHFDCRRPWYLLLALESTYNACCVGMTIATYANARTALEARKGLAPAFMCGKWLSSISLIPLIPAPVSIEIRSIPYYLVCKVFSDFYLSYQLLCTSPDLVFTARSDIVAPEHIVIVGVTLGHPCQPPA